MDQELQLVVFKLAGEEYGLPIDRVHEINRLTEITKLPQVPSFMEGIMNLRGHVMPVVDLRKRFGLDATKTEATRIIIVEVDNQTLGIIVDDVCEVLLISSADIVPPPASFVMDSDYLYGMGKVDDRLIIILKIDAILTSEEENILKVL